MKNNALTTLIGLCFLTLSLSTGIIGCGKKGDLVRPIPTEKQPPSEKHTE